MNKKVTKKIAIALCGVALTGAAMPVIANKNIQTVSANHQGTKEWIQYGTLKYDLRGPSGRVYKAGTRVVRNTTMDAKPDKSTPAWSFYLTATIGGLAGANNIQDAGGGRISETYVNLEDWHEIDYPSESITLVNNTTDPIDIASSDFHPVDPSNPDVAHANLDELKKAYADLGDIAQHDSVKGKDREVIYALNDRFMNAKELGVTQETVDTLTADIRAAIARYNKTGHLVENPDESGNTSTPNGDTTTTNPAHAHNAILRKAAYQYTHKGKRASKKRLPKGAVVKINGKVYHIKGKTYYRIAKNRYIRVANVAK